VSSSLASSILVLLRAEGGEARRVCADSRQIQPGDLFLAYPGHASDGRHHIADAVKRGAGSVLWEREGYEWDAALKVPNLPVDRLRWLASEIAGEIYGNPSQDLWMVGVTGTNGKTSISQWVARALGALDRRCAVIGTLGTGFPGQLEPANNTTPDAILLQERLAEFRSQGAQAVAMEISSIGLDQGRVDGCKMDVAVFTNLTRDHLDYHHTMDAYAAAKAKLFAMPALKSVVLNFDDLMGVVEARRLAATPLRVIGYTLVPDNRSAAPARYVLVAEHLRSTASGMRFTVLYGDQRAEMSVGLVGQFNASNLLAVIGVLIESGFSFEQAMDTVRDLTPPDGRMQTLGGIGEPLVVVDYAHTPDALEQALLALKHTAASRDGKLICVFGCGGDRDPGKRPMMGAVAHRLADHVLITSDRSAAIRQAVVEANVDDVVLIAGKGHETYQETSGKRQHFSDAEQAVASLAEWSQTRGGRA
jgi:UDP-N-acetylmuramoyl-L-alanyl-D-glutamate--2,6-diaminopimelate ligase